VGLVCETEYLDSMGGAEAFTGNLSANLSSPQYVLEEGLSRSTVKRQFGGTKSGRPRLRHLPMTGNS
jgi:hypothetical protein